MNQNFYILIDGLRYSNQFNWNLVLMIMQKPKTPKQHLRFHTQTFERLTKSKTKLNQNRIDNLNKPNCFQNNFISSKTNFFTGLPSLKNCTISPEIVISKQIEEIKRRQNKNLQNQNDFLLAEIRKCKENQFIFKVKIKGYQAQIQRLEAENQTLKIQYLQMAQKLSKKIIEIQTSFQKEIVQSLESSKFCCDESIICKKIKQRKGMSNETLLALLNSSQQLLQSFLPIELTKQISPKNYNNKYNKFSKFIHQFKDNVNRFSSSFLHSHNSQKKQTNSSTNINDDKVNEDTKSNDEFLSNQKNLKGQKSFNLQENRISRQKIQIRYLSNPPTPKRINK